jgi:glycosyltransferase involved in cell wall biosynthesis
MLRFYEPLVMLLSTRLIFITGAVADQFSLKGIRKKGRVINDGIAVEDYMSSVGEKLDGPTVITSVGRLAPYKGQDVLVRALGEVSKRGVDTETFIVGDVFADRHAYRESLIRLAADLGMADSIHFVGFQEDVKPFLERCNIFVMPANRQEPLGIVMLEAMAARRAVIATGGGGVREIVEDGDTGIVVEVGNHTEMADAIVRLATDESGRLALAGRGQESACQRFSDEAMLSSVLNLYEEVLCKPFDGSSDLKRSAPKVCEK